MPYVSKNDREFVKNLIDQIESDKLGGIGLVNYIITKTVDHYIESNNISYTTINAAIGVLECAKLELYRKKASPYEDKKCEENGEVYK